MNVKNIILAILLGLMAWAGAVAHAASTDNYLYYRDANVPPFQKSREFFDMPNRAGVYEVTMVSDTTGPLTFRVVRVQGDHETTVIQRRSYSIGNHEFQARFDNSGGGDDLIVEIANSNPAMVAKVSVFVVELLGH
ncbi:MAG: hypothetical protein ACE5E3_00050 [Mariprofundus sp.]